MRPLLGIRNRFVYWFCSIVEHCRLLWAIIAYYGLLWPIYSQSTAHGSLLVHNHHMRGYPYSRRAARGPSSINGGRCSLTGDCAVAGRTGHGPWSIDHGPLTMVHGPWSMDHVPCSMDHGQWSMDNGLWTMVHGPWSMFYGPWSMCPD